MSIFIDKILDNEDIHSLFNESELQVILSEVSETIKTDIDSRKILRLAFLLFNNIFSSNDPDKDKLEKTYILLKAINIDDNLEQFNEVFGIDGLDDELLYYFYFSVISIINDKYLEKSHSK